MRGFTGTKSRMSDRSKFALVMLLFLIFLLAGVTASILCGTARISPGELFQPENFAILKLRLARLALAMVAGASLSAAGVVFQAVLRNPLADPYLLGTSSGASLGAAVVLATGISSVFLPVGAFAGALLAIVLVYNLARFEGTVPVQTLILSGVVVGAVFSSVLLLLISLAPRQILHGAVWWLLGNLEIFDLRLLLSVSLVSILGVGWASVFIDELNLITLGEESAAHLGMRVERDKRILLGLAALITAATVSACGMIGFVGLIIPHTCRLLVGPDHRRLVPTSVLAGAVFLVTADCAARMVFAPKIIPVGALTALAGGPFFLILLRKKRRVGFH